MIKINKNLYMAQVDGNKHYIDATNLKDANAKLNKRLSSMAKEPTEEEKHEARRQARRERKRQEAKEKIEAIEWKALRHLWERELGDATSMTNEEYIEVLTSMKQFREESNKDE